MPLISWKAVDSAGMSIDPCAMNGVINGRATLGGLIWGFLMGAAVAAWTDSLFIGSVVTLLIWLWALSWSALERN